MACPFFFPLEPMDRRRWPGRPETPLGEAFSGECRTIGKTPMVPDDSIQKEHCNFGYPDDCPYFPKQHPYQAIRFAIIHDKNEKIVASYIMENNHQPHRHGELIFNTSSRQIENPHSNPIVHRQSLCYFEAFLKKKEAVQQCPGE